MGGRKRAVLPSEDRRRRRGEWFFKERQLRPADEIWVERKGPEAVCGRAWKISKNRASLILI